MSASPEDAAVNKASVSPSQFNGFVSKEAQELFESKFWIKNYPPGVDPEVKQLPAQSMLEVMLSSLKKYADRPA
ncbi:MAG: long-chain fatty acid--CoA ligase, partial [Limnobacter sp.]|nr:long-chain fatty acid--CoA ligase [Limnobacter sp.]